TVRSYSTMLFSWRVTGGGTAGATVLIPLITCRLDLGARCASGPSFVATRTTAVGAPVPERPGPAALLPPCDTEDNAAPAITASTTSAPTYEMRFMAASF